MPSMNRCGDFSGQALDLTAVERVRLRLGENAGAEFQYNALGYAGHGKKEIQYK